MTNHAATEKDIFHVAGDAPDPEGIDPRARGVAPGYDLSNSATGKPLVQYKMSGEELRLEFDVYNDLEGVKPHIMLICPWCLARRGESVGLRIFRDHKHYDFNVDERVPPFPGWSEDQMAKLARSRAGGIGGRLTINEVIGCTWEADPSSMRSQGVNGFAICQWRVKITDNVARDV